MFHVEQFAELLHWVGSAFAQTFVNDAFHFAVGFLRDSSLLCAEAALLRAQFALLRTELAYLCSELALLGADASLDLAHLALQISELALNVRELLFGQNLSLIGFELGHGGLEFSNLFAHVRGRNAGELLLATQIFLLLAQNFLAAAELFLLLAERFHGLIHVFNLIHDGRVVDVVGLAVAREPEKVSVRHLAGFFKLFFAAVEPLAGELNVLPVAFDDGVGVAVW